MAKRIDFFRSPLKEICFISLVLAAVSFGWVIFGDHGPEPMRCVELTDDTGRTAVYIDYSGGAFILRMHDTGNLEHYYREAEFYEVSCDGL